MVIKLRPRWTFFTTFKYAQEQNFSGISIVHQLQLKCPSSCPRELSPYAFSVQFSVQSLCMWRMFILDEAPVRVMRPWHRNWTVSSMENTPATVPLQDLEITYDVPPHSSLHTSTRVDGHCSCFPISGKLQPSLFFPLSIAGLQLYPPSHSPWPVTLPSFRGQQTKSFVCVGLSQLTTTSNQLVFSAKPVARDGMIWQQLPLTTTLTRERALLLSHSSHKTKTLACRKQTLQLQTKWTKDMKLYPPF